MTQLAMVDVEQRPIDAEQTRLARRYLLGELSQAENEAFESRYFGDPDLFRELSATEDDLIDSYVRSGLSRTERVDFESHFLSVPSRIERVKFARTLAEYAAAENQDSAASVSLAENARSVRSRIRLQPLRLRWAAACLALIVSGGAIWVAHTNQQLRSRLHEVQVQQAELRGHEQDLNRRLEEARSQLQQERSRTGDPIPLAAQLRRPGTSLVILSLVTDSFRSIETMPTLPLAPGISNVWLFLNEAPEKPGRYDVSIETAEGEQVFEKRDTTLQHVSVNRKMIALDLPAGIFKSGDYILSLAAHSRESNSDSASATYAFRVKAVH